MSGKGDTYRKLNSEQRKAFEDNFDRIFNKPKHSEDWQHESRDKAIAQNGNNGDHYEELKEEK